jgi:hypothetical protein
MKAHFLLDVLDWAEKRPEGFSYDELMSSRNFQEWERSILDGYFQNASTNHKRKGLPNFTHIPETIFHVIKTGDDHTQQKFVLTSDALFKHIDHGELKLARENAIQARRFSWVAIVLSILAMGVSALVPWWIATHVTQTVDLETQQIESINL